MSDDLLVEMPVDYDVPASGEDIYRYFVIPSELVEDKAIVAIDFRPRRRETGATVQLPLASDPVLKAREKDEMS